MTATNTKPELTALYETFKDRPFMKDKGCILYSGEAHYLHQPDMTGAELRQFIEAQAHQQGYTLAAKHCGHLIGKFPHERHLDETHDNYIRPNTLDKSGQPRHWILEVHLISPCNTFGGFFEDLLTL